MRYTAGSEVKTCTPFGGSFCAYRRRHQFLLGK